MRKVFVFLCLLLLAVPAVAQMSGGSSKGGNVVAFYDQDYFGTIDGTTINASQYVFIKPIRCYSNVTTADSLGTVMWGNRVRFEIQCDNFATGGNASVEFGRSYILPYAWDVTDYDVTRTSAPKSAIPMNQTATTYSSSPTLMSDNFTAYGTATATHLTALNQASAAASLTHTVQYLDVFAHYGNLKTPLPPVLLFAFDAGTGTWSSGTVKVRAWVFAE